MLFYQSHPHPLEPTTGTSFMSSTPSETTAFHELGLIEPLLRALDDVGYETPSPIQAETIPPLLEGKDIVGQAQTGTGKTAAFALPLLSRLDLSLKQPQLLVLAPTRELAIQVSEAFQRYAHYLKGFHVLPIYGGQDYRTQLRQLKRGVQVVVGTPGRVMDHMRRGTLKLDALKALVLDEADEMLRMGFIDDVEWILEQTPEERQIALFSATMPTVIRRIAKKHLNDPNEITIKVKTSTAETIRQRYWMVSGLHKLDALTRILEAEPFDAMIIFVRTKTATVELAEKLEARGYASAPLNGDIQQKQRERTVEQLKQGKIDIVVATDVAARGLDVQRISHVINYDVPYDTESYVHRIGRTGRAGRTGDAILFVSPREKRMLFAIEKATRQKITLMELPSTEEINDQRVARFKQSITDTIAAGEIDIYHNILEQYRREHDIPALEIAAALAKMVQGEQPFLLRDEPRRKRKTREDSADRVRDDKSAPRRDKERKPRRDSSKPAEGMERFRLEVGKRDGVQPANIVGAIANEAGLDGQYIDNLKIEEEYSLVDLPVGMPRDLFKRMKKVWVCGKQLRIKRTEEKKRPPPARAHGKDKKGKRKKSGKKNRE